MSKRRQSKNIFLQEYTNESKDLIPSAIEDEILTHYFELGYDEKDMMSSEVRDFLLTLGVQEIIIDKYKQHAVANNSSDTDNANNDNQTEKFNDLLVAGLEDEGIVDFDKLLFLSYKFVLLRDNYEYVEQFWKVFVQFAQRALQKESKANATTAMNSDGSGGQFGEGSSMSNSNSNSSGSIYDQEITFPQLKAVIKGLKLDDKINDGLIIDMIANGSEEVKPAIGFFDFMILMGKADELNA